jgi:hypothetical protein
MSLAGSKPRCRADLQLRQVRGQPYDSAWLRQNAGVVETARNRQRQILRHRPRQGLTSRPGPTVSASAGRPSVSTQIDVRVRRVSREQALEGFHLARVSEWKRRRRSGRAWRVQRKAIRTGNLATLGLADPQGPLGPESIERVDPGLTSPQPRHCSGFCLGPFGSTSEGATMAVLSPSRASRQDRGHPGTPR